MSRRADSMGALGCRASRTLPLALLVAGLALAAACADDAMDPVAPSDPSFDRVDPGATFDWSMPARFGADGDGDGLVDYPTPEGLRPESWRVDFDACGLPGDRFTWYVDDRVVGRVETCTFRYDFPAEAVYRVAVHAAGAGTSTWAEEEVTVQDWLIVSFGDSYASGEGVPEVPQAAPALVSHVEDLILDVLEVQSQLQTAQTSLQEALERKGLAQQILNDATARLNAFLAACTIEEFKDILACASFLASLPGSFDNFSQAKAYLDQAVQNAQDRIDAAQTAINAAQSAVTAATNAIASLQAAIVAAGAGFDAPRWQSKYAVETYAQDQECHRSAAAAPARAALAIENADPRTSVTFLHLACSGAKMEGGRAPLETQIRWADALIGDREIDAVFLSIGGNDAGFAGLATGCAVQELCSEDDPEVDLADAQAACSVMSLLGFGSGCNDFFAEQVPAQSSKKILEDGLALLPGRYARIADEVLPGLEGLLAPERGPGLDGLGFPIHTDPLERLRAGRVYISEYVDMTKDDAGAYCTPGVGGPLGVMPGFSIPELTWLDHTAASGINAAVEAAADAHGWGFVTGIYSGYREHGYCAVSHWVTRLHETFLRQGDMSGIAHPAAPGQDFSGAAIAAAARADLYPAELGGAPRAPDGPAGPAVVAGGG